MAKETIGNALGMNATAVEGKQQRAAGDAGQSLLV